MADDEERIRELIESWHQETAAGNVRAILRLMADDVIFLAPGQPPMDKAASERGLRAILEGNRIASKSDIREIRVLDGWAYCWSELSVTVVPRSGGLEQRRKGFVLSILRKSTDGAWLMARDANMLGEEKEAGP